MGLRNPQAVRALLRLICVENPSLIFLMETHLKEQEMSNIKFKCDMDYVFVVDCSGQGKDRVDGITLMWKYIIQLTINLFAINHISGSIMDEKEDQPWFFSGVYGFLKEINNRRTWSLFQRLQLGSGPKWLCFGDFNDILSEKKQGGNAISCSQFE